MSRAPVSVCQTRAPSCVPSSPSQPCLDGHGGALSGTGAELSTPKGSHPHGDPEKSTGLDV